MIKIIIGECMIVSNNFNPHNLLIPEKIRIFRKYAIGELITEGSLKGTFSTDATLIFDGSIDDVLSFIESILVLPFAKELDWVSFSILVAWEDQCNFELSSEELSRIAKLNLTLSITCYEAAKGS